MSFVLVWVIGLLVIAAIYFGLCLLQRWWLKGFAVLSISIAVFAFGLGAYFIGSLILGRFLNAVFRR